MADHPSHSISTGDTIMKNDIKIDTIQNDTIKSDMNDTIKNDLNDTIKNDLNISQETPRLTLLNDSSPVKQQKPSRLHPINKDLYTISQYSPVNPNDIQPLMNRQLPLKELVKISRDLRHDDTKNPLLKLRPHPPLNRLVAMDITDASSLDGKKNDIHQNKNSTDDPYPLYQRPKAPGDTVKTTIVRPSFTTDEEANESMDRKSIKHGRYHPLPAVVDKSSVGRQVHHPSRMFQYV